MRGGVSRINDCGYKTRGGEPLDTRGKKVERTQQTSDIGQAHQGRAPDTRYLVLGIAPVRVFSSLSTELEIKCI